MNKQIVANERLLKYRTILVLENVNGEKKKIGTMRPVDALELARSKERDLILISEADVPVCLIYDIGKYRYELEKSDSHHEAPKMKEIYLSLSIAKHDIETKLHQTQKLIEKGHNVRVVIELRKFEMANKNAAKLIIEDFISSFAKKGKLQVKDKGFDCILFGAPKKV